MNVENFDGDGLNSEELDGQVCHSNSGRYLLPFSLLRKTRGRKLSKDSVNGVTPEEYRKGLNSEKLFQAMFNYLIEHGHIPKEYRVRKASRNQDERFKIDWWIDIYSKKGRKISIPIQIKSSSFAGRMFIAEFGSKFPNVYLVVMNSSMTTERLLQEVLKIVKIEFDRLSIKPTT